MERETQKKEKDGGSLTLARVFTVMSFIFAPETAAAPLMKPTSTLAASVSSYGDQATVATGATVATVATVATANRVVSCDQTINRKITVFLPAEMPSPVRASLCWYFYLFKSIAG